MEPVRPNDNENLTDWAKRAVPWAKECLEQNSGVDGALKEMLKELKGHVNPAFVCGFLCGIELTKVEHD